MKRPQTLAQREAAAPLRPYFGYPKDGLHEVAVLVFARNGREAKPLAWRSVVRDCTDRYTDVRVRRIREHTDWFMALAESADPHVIDDPPSCKRCEHWGRPIKDGICTACHDWLAEEAAAGVLP